MPTDQELFDELCFYTLSHPDPAFLHQHAVDSFAAQHADAQSKPITVVFGLIGLYLFLEKGFTGKQVQKMHMQLARQRKVWPAISPPGVQARITVSDVLAAPRGPERDNAIRDWCVSVWETWQPRRGLIVDLVRKELDIA